MHVFQLNDKNVPATTAAQDFFKCHIYALFQKHEQSLVPE
jgi:hypothetical protein